LQTAIHTFENEADEVEELLRSMGLSGEALTDVCRQGLAEYLTATPFHPRNAAGSLMYLELVKALREKLVPAGWAIDEDGLALTFNEKLGIAIAVRSGDTHAGDSKKNPSFKYPESVRMLQAIELNAQLGLFDGVPGLAAFATPERPQRVDHSKLQTWWLLHHVDTGRDVMRAELSLPVKIGEGGEMDQWKTRIILGSIPFDDEPRVVLAGADDLGDADIDVPVRKKVS
jgi:hypothetical protein